MRPLLDRGDGLVDGRGHVVDVLGGQTAHVDAAAGHQVDVFLLHHELHLFGCGKHRKTSNGPSRHAGAAAALAGLTVESCEAEHADLIGDVVPGSRRAQTLELLLQLSPHQQHSVCHGLHVVLPAATQTNSHQKAPRGTRSSCRGAFGPFGEQLRRVQRDGDDPSSLGWGVGPRGSDNLLHLGQSPLQVVRITSHDGQVPHALI